MQQSVNIFPADATIGTWATDRLKSAFGFVVRGTGATAAVAATGTITASDNPSANDTVTVGATTYTFVASSPTGAQVLIGATAAASMANLAAIISGMATASASTTTVTVTASIAGTIGNSIVLAKSSTNLTVSGAKLSGGTDYVAGNNATIGRAFTMVSGTDNVAIMGGTGVYAGIFVNPYNQAIYSGLTPTLAVPDGVEGEFCQSGYIWVALSNSSAAGDAIFFTQATGILSGGTASTGQTQIKGAKVVKGGGAGVPVLISIIPQV